MEIQGLHFPDKCPKDCLYKNNIMEYGQSAVCRYCPIFCCYLNPADPENGFDEPWRMIEPEDMREDWLHEWYEYFTNKKEPKLEFVSSSSPTGQRQ